MSDGKQMFAQAVELHQTGHIKNAEKMYRDLLADDPKNIDVLRLLGTACYQLGEKNEAIRLMEASLALASNQPEAWNNLGVALHDVKQLDKALASFNNAIAQAQNYAFAYRNRGNVLKDLKRNNEALADYDRAIALMPNYPEAHNNRGSVLQDLKRHDESLASYNTAMRLNPKFPEALNNRGNLFRELKRFKEALADYEQAIALKPELAEAHSNRGDVLTELGRPDEALESLSKALSLNPRLAQAYAGKGDMLHAKKQHEEALVEYDQALALKPDFVEALNNRGNVLRTLKRPKEALRDFEQAIALDSGLAEAHNNRGNALHDLKRYDEALASLDRALELNPSFATSHYNRGSILRDLKRYDEAIVNFSQALALKADYAEAFRARGETYENMKRYEDALVEYKNAVEIKPELAYLLGALLHTKMHLCDWQSFDAMLQTLKMDIESGESSSMPFALISTPLSAELQKTSAEIFVKYDFPAKPASGQNTPYRHDRIRLGYFSSDMHGGHPMGYLMPEIFERHDRSKFEVIAFFFGPPINDPVQKRNEKSVDRFIDVRAKTDAEIAAMAKEMEIDIAIDLNGYTTHGRPGIFAFRTAPLQVNYLGYPGTIGASYTDYIIADPLIIPEAQRHFYSEKVITLPDTYQVNAPRGESTSPTFTRAQMNLPENAFVFCAFHNTFKITPDVFAVWMRLLQQVKNSVLWLLGGSGTCINNLCAEAATHGIHMDRLIFARRMGRDDHLARHGLADLFLDTFYYNAHTTTSDAIWEGLPVVTCMGNSFASRVAGSLLNAANLPELVTHSPAEYEALALELATTPERLAAIRAKIAQERTRCPLFNAAQTVKHLENAYQRIQQRAQDGLAPEHMEVKI